LTAGLATLTELTVSEIDRINRLGKKLRTEVNKLMDAAQSALIEMKPYITHTAPYLISG